MVRSDSGVAHRLSLSARVVSAVDSQVKAKQQGEKRLWRLQIQRAQEYRRQAEITVLTGEKQRFRYAPAAPICN